MGREAVVSTLVKTETNMNPNDIMKGPVAALKLPRSNALLILYLKTLHDAMASAGALASPTSPTLAQFLADIGALETCQTQAGTRAKGTAKVRNAAKRRALLDARHLRDFVQQVADSQPSAADAAAVIASAGMGERAKRTFHKPPLAAKWGSVSGEVVLVAKAVGVNATYFWQVSSDQKSWSNAPETMKATTVISGLTPGQTYYFRFRALTRAGQVDFSQVVSLLVH